MNRKKSIYFVLGIAVTAALLTVVLTEANPWMSMAAQSSVLPTQTPTHTPTSTSPPTQTPTHTPPPTQTPTNTPPPTPTQTPTNTPPPTQTPTQTPTNTPPPTQTPTSTPPTPTATPLPLTPTALPPTPTPTPGNAPLVLTVDHPVISVDEGGRAVNGGSVVDLDGRLVGLAASAGDLQYSAGAWFWSYTAPDGPSSQTVEVRATDDDGAATTVTFELQIVNLAPDVGAIQAPATTIPAGARFDLSARFVDPMDSHVAVIQWGDGTMCRTDPGSECSLDEAKSGVGSVSASHSYAQAGRYTVQLSVTDDDGDTGTSTLELEVVDDPIELKIVGWRFGPRRFQFRWPFLYAWLELKVENRSTQDVHNVSVALTDHPPKIRVLKGTLTVGDLPAGSSGWSEDTLRLRLRFRDLRNPKKVWAWAIEYDDAAGVHHVIEDTYSFRGGR